MLRLPADCLAAGAGAKDGFGAAGATHKTPKPRVAAPPRANDPWKTFAPQDEDVPTRTAVRQLFKQTAKYLAAGGGPKYRCVRVPGRS